MTEKVTGNSAWETTNMNDGMERHGEMGCREAECCSKRISSGCCPRRYEQELDEILDGKIADGILDGAWEAGLNSAMYNDGDTDEDIDEETGDEHQDPHLKDQRIVGGLQDPVHDQRRRGKPQ